MTREYDKRGKVDAVTRLREAGFSRSRIMKLIGISETHLDRLIKEFDIKKGEKCPNCGCDKTDLSALNPVYVVSGRAAKQQ